MKTSLLVAVLLAVSLAGCSESPVTTEPMATDETGSTSVPTVTLLDITDCKGYATGIRMTAPSDQACVEYWYVGQSTLHLRHINAGFNCCPVLEFNTSVVRDTIFIEEIEIEGLCLCQCLYDVEFEISNINPGTYHLVVIEPYLNEGDPVLEGTLDLEATASGRFCVPRSGYPWGF